MSKFFDETVRARNAAPVDSAKLASVQQFLDATAASMVAAADPGTSRLEQCRKIRIALSSDQHAAFKGSDSLRPAEESYRALRTRLLRLRGSQGIRSVVVTSATQGEGKTLTSLNLAVCCAQLHDMRILLVDADLRNHGLSKALSLPPKPGLAEVLSGQCEPESAILETDIPNLYTLSSGSPTTPPAELFASRRWNEFIGWCNESFKLILIDSPPVMNLADVELINAPCDGILMVVRANHAKREILQMSARQIDSKKLLGVVYNAAENGSHHRYQFSKS
jgi:capsular exopolysaccharide synthesis family protein